MVVIRWKDIFETLEAAVDACETRRQRARGHRTAPAVGAQDGSDGAQPALSGVVTGALVGSASDHGERGGRELV